MVYKTVKSVLENEADQWNGGARVSGRWPHSKSNSCQEGGDIRYLKTGTYKHIMKRRGRSSDWAKRKGHQINMVGAIFKPHSLSVTTKPLLNFHVAMAFAGVYCSASHQSLLLPLTDCSIFLLNDKWNIHWTKNISLDIHTDITGTRTSNSNINYFQSKES